MSQVIKCRILADVWQRILNFLRWLLDSLADKPTERKLMAAIPQVVTDALNAFAEADEAYDADLLLLVQAQNETIERRNAVIDAENAEIDRMDAVDASKAVKNQRLEDLKAAITAGFGE